MATPSGSVHRCPDCGGGFAQRRTPRGQVERLRAALTGRRPYRCLQCGRRFYDRPAGPAGHAVEAAPPEFAGGLGARHRQAYWRVDMGADRLRPTEIYLAVVIVLIVVAIGTALLLLLWPEAETFVRQGR